MISSGGGVLSTFDVLSPSTVGPIPDVLAGRYRTEECIGVGGAGHVYRAHDTLTDQQVAIKWLRVFGVDRASRARREVLALRALRLPGVVRLLDDGVEDSHQYIVMELVDGHPFPGRAVPLPWPAVRETVFALLETLARVHQTGIVHRDLKPGNVLVDRRGRPTMLDFGLARGDVVGQPITGSGAVVGTPRYQAPEQVLGEPADARTDLYSLGVMIFEALTGKAPQAARAVEDILRARVEERATPLSELAPAVPRHVAGVVDRLLRRHPADRFSSAIDVLCALRGEQVDSDGIRVLPRLGDEGPQRALFAALAAGRSVDISGSSGSGRTRCLREAADRAAVDGRSVFWLARGDSPFESLGGMLAKTEGKAGMGEMRAAVRQRLGDHLEQGGVILADNAERIDRWSAEVLESVQHQGAVVRAFADRPDAAIQLLPLSVHDLRCLFHGPERVLHLPADGALELWRRTEGLPSRVDAEVGAWVRAGLCAWDGEHIAISRPALDGLRGGVLVSPTGLRVRDENLPHDLEELLAWVHLARPHATVDLVHQVSGRPVWQVEAQLDEMGRRGAVLRSEAGTFEPRMPSLALQRWEPAARRAAHRLLARLLPPGAEGRLLHLVVCDGAAEVVDEAIAVARLRSEQGRLGEAVAALHGALGVVIDSGDTAGRVVLLTWWSRIALSIGTPAAFDRALYEIRRARDDEHLAAWRLLLEAAQESARGEGELALALLGGQPTGPTAEYETAWFTARVMAALRCDDESLERVIDEVQAWSRSQGDPADVVGRVTGWVGLLRYRQGRYAEAAQLEMVAARSKRSPTGRLSARLNAAAALLEVFRWDEVMELCQHVMEEAAQGRNVSYEARAECLWRSAALRAGHILEPDLELVEILAQVGQPDLEAVAALNEAAVAWRTGVLELAASLAARSAVIYESLRMDKAALLARSLERACTGPHPWAVLAPTWARLLACTVPAVRVQGMSLLLRGAEAPPAEAGSVLVAEVSAFSAPAAVQCREVMSPAEALEVIS